MPSHFTYEISDVQRSLQSHRIVLGPEPGYSHSYFIPFPLGTWPYIRDKGSGCSFLFGLSLGVSCFDNPLTHTHRHTDTHTKDNFFPLHLPLACLQGHGKAHLHERKHSPEVKSLVSEARLPRFTSQLCHLSAVELWAGFCASVSTKYRRNKRTQLIGLAESRRWKQDVGVATAFHRGAR